MMDPTLVNLNARTGQFISENSEIPPDITFKFTKDGGDDEVLANKTILSLVSGVFRNMFFVHDTEDRLAKVIVLEDTTKQPFLIMIHAMYNFKPMKESLQGKSIDLIFAVLYLVTKYEIPELVLAVKEHLSSLPITEDNVLEIATDAMEYISTFGEEAQGILISCAKFLENKLTGVKSYNRFVADNGDRMATVHKLAVLMKDLTPPTCSGCRRKPTECLNGESVKASNVMVGARVRRNPSNTDRLDESQGVGVIVRKDDSKGNLHWFVRWENNQENGGWFINCGGIFLFKCD